MFKDLFTTLYKVIKRFKNPIEEAVNKTFVAKIENKGNLHFLLFLNIFRPFTFNFEDMK